MIAFSPENAPSSISKFSLSSRNRLGVNIVLAHERSALLLIFGVQTPGTAREADPLCQRNNRILASNPAQDDRF
jgi:hypothetical protein